MPSITLALYTQANNSNAPDSRDDQIYKEILQAIIDRRLKPATRLPEDSLADAFQVSRTVIRKALQRLALQRMVSIKPKRGASVASPSIKEARDVFVARRVIESGLLDQVVQQVDEEGFLQLRQLAEREIKARADNHRQEEIQLSARFHVQLAMATDNIILSEQVAQLTSITSLIIALYGSDESTGCTCGAHTELLDLLESERLGEAKSWMENHLERIYQSLNIEEKNNPEVDFQSLFKRRDD